MIRKAFTLIELLVVIAVIGVLSSIVIASLNQVRAKARDTKRLADMRTISNSLTVYAIDTNGNYPTPTTYGRSNVSPGFWDGYWDVSSNNAAANSFINFLVTSGKLPQVPLDPRNSPSPDNGSPTSGYKYFYRSGISIPDSVSGSTYHDINGAMIGISKFEARSGSTIFVGCPSDINLNGAYSSMAYLECVQLN